ncbi:hypothetical protein [Streptomyces sp. CdTB01]|uniref:hypothetical protein n=1 Tax=Streptomyces sp. CdTB01 TaxID=1725411 RepID=UPI00131F3E0C|nr:hypothetical protein [Streptomyces sp. CdTB01]
MSKLTSRLMRNFEARFGYPPGENVLLKADPELRTKAVQALSAIDAPRDLIDFYSQVEEITLPDVENGLFVHSMQAVVEGVAGNQPTEVVGAVKGSVTVFGSDGGGGLLALNRAGDKVYRLSGGSLIGSTYEVEDSGVQVISNGFSGFLDYLRRELSQVIQSM